MTRALMIAAAAVLLAGCAGKPSPEPVIVTHEVKVLVPVPCDPKITVKRPDFDGMKRVFAAAPGVFERGQIVLVYALDLTAWAEEAGAGLKECASSPK